MVLACTAACTLLHFRMTSVPWDSLLESDYAAALFISKSRRRPRQLTAAHEAMSATGLPSLLDLLSVEVLERIFLFTSVPDIFRLLLVSDITLVVGSRTFANRGSPKGQ